MASLLVMLVIFLLDITTFALAIAAERKRSSVQVIPDIAKEYTYCIYSSSVASLYGATAFILLMAGQVLLMVTTGCLCCGKFLNSGTSKACAIFLFIISWFTFLMAEAFLIVGSVRNALHTQTRAMFDSDPPECRALQPGIFEAGAALIFCTTILGESYYVCCNIAGDAECDGYGTDLQE